MVAILGGTKMGGTRLAVCQPTNAPFFVLSFALKREEGTSAIWRYRIEEYTYYLGVLITTTCRGYSQYTRSKVRGDDILHFLLQ